MRFIMVSRFGEGLNVLYQIACEGNETEFYLTEGGKEDLWKGMLTRTDVLPLEKDAIYIFDMSGNVWEWAGDWYAEKYNPRDLIDPKGQDKGIYRVVRGGSWYYYNAVNLLAAFRYYSHPAYQDYNIGFRVAEDLF